MLLPLTGLLFALIVFGALALLVSKSGDRFPELGPPPWLRYAALACLCGGLGAALVPLALGAARGGVLGSHWLAGAAAVGGFVLGGCGGAALGLRRASKRVRRG